MVRDNGGTQSALPAPPRQCFFESSKAQALSRLGRTFCVEPVGAPLLGVRVAPQFRMT